MQSKSFIDIVLLPSARYGPVGDDICVSSVCGKVQPSCPQRKLFRFISPPAGGDGRVRRPVPEIIDQSDNRAETPK